MKTKLLKISFLFFSSPMTVLHNWHIYCPVQIRVVHYENCRHDTKKNKININKYFNIIGRNLLQKGDAFKILKNIAAHC